MKILAEAKAEQLISKYLPVAKSILTRNIEQAIKFAKKYPVVIKLISPKALHKTEVGGVKIISSEEELRNEFSSMISFAKKKKLPLEGVLVNLGLKLLEKRKNFSGLKGKRRNKYGYDNAINDLYLMEEINTDEVNLLEKYKSKRNNAADNESLPVYNKKSTF